VWSGESDEFKFHLVNWSTFLHTMRNGRLGVCKLNTFKMVIVIWRGKYSFVEEWFC